MSTEQWSRLSTDAFNVALFAYIAGMIGYFYYLAFRRQLAWRSASLAALLGLSAHALSVVARGFAAGRDPPGGCSSLSLEPAASPGWVARSSASLLPLGIQRVVS